MKAKTLHMIGNAHIDPVWLWQWQEGYQEIKASFRSALDRMNEYDDFRFTGSSAAFYEWVEENDPKMFAEIQQRVAEGRWEIVGGWWIQPDCNVPSGESFVRQGLYGQHYFKAKFGVTAKVGYNPDSFGHHAMLPQILRKQGMDYYVFMRPSPHEQGLPARVFWWESDDGSRVLTFRIPFEYLTGPDEVRSHVVRCAGEIKEPVNELMCFYGVGNHGGGPTKKNIEAVKRWDAHPDFPRLVFSTPNRFFAAVENLAHPVVHGELQHHASGCYAAHSGIKRWNRQAENMLVAAEKFSAVAQRLTGQPYPADFARAWKNVLFNQFHDILAGTSIEPAYDDARDMHGEAMSIGARALNHAIQSLAWNIDIPMQEGMKPVVVFNPHPWPVRQNVEMEWGRFQEGEGLLDDEGRPVPFQFVRSLATVSSWRRRLSFQADLPPFGYRVYRMLPGAAHHFTPRVEATDTSLENERFRLEINPETGCISRLYYKKQQFEVLKGEGARPVVIDDPSDTWSHDVLHFQNAIGTFRPVNIKLLEHGPVKSVLRVESEYGTSRLLQDFTMYGDMDRIDVHVTIDWHERFKALKFRFPVNLWMPRATYEVSYGHIERPTNGEEEPGQNWFDLSGLIRATGAMYGLSILNDGKYSFDITGGEMGLTAVRSPIYAHHDPYVPTPDGQYSFVDQGIQRFTYSLLPHSGSWEQAGTVRQGWEINQKPVTLIETYHDGALPQRNSFLAVDQPNLVVSVVKQAEEGSDLVIRCYETSRVATRGTIRIPLLGRTIEADFGPCEIKTFRIPADPAAPVVETNLLEWVD